MKTFLHRGITRKCGRRNFGHVRGRGRGRHHRGRKSSGRIFRKPQLRQLSPAMIINPYLPTGPYKVGVRDLGLYAGPGELAPDKHLAGRLFYPCADASRSWTPILWTGSLYSAHAYACFPFIFQTGWRNAVLRNVLTVVAWCLGSSARIWGYWNAGLPPVPQAVAGLPPVPNTGAEDSSDSTFTDGELFPVVIISHGLAGQRNTYSSICVELASQGFVVVAVEHADGSASIAQMAGPGLTWTAWQRETVRQALGTWRWFRGLGAESIMWYKRTEWRVTELQTALRVLSQLNQGRPDPHLWMSGCSKGDGLSSLFKGRLDLTRVAAMGHSYGGATAALAAASDPAFKCGVAMDPWWDALPPESPALTGWLTASPLLALGSHQWNTRDVSTGKMRCNEEKQDQVMEAARSQGAGALLIVPTNSTHHSFNDIGLLFGSLLEPLFRMMYKSTNADMCHKRAMQITCATARRFLADHLPMRVAAPGRTAAAAAATAAAAVVGKPFPLTPGHDRAYREILGADLHFLKIKAM